MEGAPVHHRRPPPESRDNEGLYEKMKRFGIE
jgi:hypothetical protein